MKHSFIKIAVALAMLVAPLAHAQENEVEDDGWDGPLVARWVGFVMLFGGLGGLAAAIPGASNNKDEAEKCRQTNALGGSLRCTNQKELDDVVRRTKTGTIVSGGLVVGGAILLFSNLEETKALKSLPFNVRPMLGGVELEKNGLSLAATGDEISLQKRWTF